MTRWREAIWPAVGLSAVAFAGYLLLKELRGQSLAGISDADAGC